MTSLAVTDRWARLPTVFTGFLVLLMTALAFAPEAAGWLQLDRDAVAAGQLWRLATCHLVHWNIEHACWDIAVFTGLGALCVYREGQRLTACFVGSALAIALGVWLAAPQVQIYRGASGVDSALFALLAVGLIREAARDRDRLRLLVLGALGSGFIAKVAWETVTAQTIFVDAPAAGFVPVPLAHAIGAAVGIAVSWQRFSGERTKERRRAHPAHPRASKASGALLRLLFPQEPRNAGPGPPPAPPRRRDR